MPSIKKSNISSFSTQFSLKKDKERRPVFFSHKKLWIGAGIIFVIVLLLTGRGLFLSANGLGPNLLTHQEELQNDAASLDGVNLQDESAQEISSESGRDLQVGPVRLSNSTYITDSLDKFVEEKNAQQAVDEARTKEESDKAFSSQAFSIQAAINDPIKFLEGFGYTTKQTFINNNRKTTLIKLIDSISRYYISYNKFPDLAPEQDYGDYAWIQEMVDKNEMSGVYQYVIKTVEPVAYCGTAKQTGYCYSTNDSDAIIYVRLEKPFESDVCGMDNGLFLLWSSTDNKFGNVCLNQEPSVFGGFDYFILK